MSGRVCPALQPTSRSRARPPLSREQRCSNSPGEAAGGHGAFVPRRTRLVPIAHERQSRQESLHSGSPLASGAWTEIEKPETELERGYREGRDNLKGPRTGTSSTFRPRRSSCCSRRNWPHSCGKQQIASRFGTTPSPPCGSWRCMWRSRESFEIRTCSTPAFTTLPCSSGSAKARSYFDNCSDRVDAAYASAAFESALASHPRHRERHLRQDIDCSTRWSTPRVFRSHSGQSCSSSRSERNGRSLAGMSAGQASLMGKLLLPLVASQPAARVGRGALCCWNASHAGLLPAHGCEGWAELCT